ncbi:hypothetical protein ABFX02_12G011100 [Erythranthe guttata]
MEYSGNSGSLQSSSGGDEEYESRAAGSIFMNSSTTHHPAPPPHVIGPISNPPPQPPFFDPFSNYMQLLHSNMTWPRPPATSFRSDPNTLNPMLSASSHALRPPPAAAGEGSNNSGVSAPTVANQAAAAARNPRKRSRASRRAPTTVLTTDTTNFRAMVQEFTGVPAPPFIQRGGLDLFGPRSTAFESPPPPPYLRRPFSQKDQPPPQFRASSTPADGGCGGGMGGSSTQSWNLFNVTNPKFVFSNNSSDNIAGNLIPPDQTAAENNSCNENTDNKNAAARWRNNNEEGYKPVGGPYNFPATTPTNGNMNYSGEKVPAAENIITARGLSEGMVESWICSSSE